MRFKLLDGITVTSAPDGEIHRFPPIQAQALFALAAAGRSEAGQRKFQPQELTDLLWPDGPPSDSKRLAKTLGPIRKVVGDRLVRGDLGYELRIRETDVLDLDVFRKLVIAAEDHAVDDPAVALRAYSMALEEFVGLPDHLPRSALRDGLIDERLTVVEHRAEVQLRLGMHTKIAEEFPALVRLWPRRERLLGQLIRALYRSQRRDDAEEWYEWHLTNLGGRAVTREMARLHQQMRDADPKLTPPPFGLPTPDRAVLAAGGDIVKPTTARMSSVLTQSVWRGHGQVSGEFHSYADRFAVSILAALAPQVLTIQYEAVQLARVLVQWFARQHGIRQFVEFGALPPTSLAVHNAARLPAPDSRTVYLNSDPAVVKHSQGLVASVDGVEFMLGDLDAWLTGRAQTGLLDPAEPIFVLDQHQNNVEHDNAEYARQYADLASRLASGSILAWNSSTVEGGISEPVMYALERMYASSDEMLYPRTRAQLLNLVPPNCRILPPPDRELTGDGILPTTDLYEAYAARKSPDINRPGQLPRLAVVAQVT